MLRILHTADWHLGQSFHGYGRDYEHACFLDWLLAAMLERQPDALILAGDVFDSVNPPATAQRRLYDFLARAHRAQPSLQIVLTAGNHDAGARLEAPSGLLERLNITAIGAVTRDELGAPILDKFLVPLQVPDGRVGAIVLAIPFLRPCDVPEMPGSADPYLDGIRELYRRAIEKALEARAREFPEAALIAMGHCHLQDAAESRDSERRIVIGGAEAVRIDTFPPELAYVALGHLHKPQELDGGRIRYSGSPIPLSFSEKDYEHRVLELSVDPAGSVSATSLPIPKTAALLRLPLEGAAPLAEVLHAIHNFPFDAKLPPEAHPFLEVRVLDDGPDPTRRRQIEQALEGKPVRLALIKPESRLRAAEAAVVEGESSALPALADLDPEVIMITAHRERYGADPDPLLLAALREILSSQEIASAFRA